MAVPKELHIVEPQSSSDGELDDAHAGPDFTGEISYFDDVNCIDHEINQFHGDGNDGDPEMCLRECRSLSYGALQLLRHASKSVMKRKKQRRLRVLRSIRRNRSAIEVAATGYEVAMKAADASGVAADGEVSMKVAADDHLLLLKELDHLSSLIPSHYCNNSYGDLDSEPCVVKDALAYLKFLKEEIRCLNEGLVTPLESKLRTCLDAQVEVKVAGAQKLQVKVSCKKRAGLLADLMSVLESKGLIFDNVDVSCQHHLILQAMSSQKGVDSMDKQAIRRALLMEIYKN